MDHYLSNIAARSTGFTSNSLQPSNPVSPVTEQGFAEEKIPQFGSFPGIVQPAEPMPLKEKEDPVYVQTKPVSKPGKPYFSKHTDRLNVEREIISPEYKPQYNKALKIEEPIGKAEVGQKPVEIIQAGKTKGEEKITTIVPGKKIRGKETVIKNRAVNESAVNDGETERKNPIAPLVEKQVQEITRPQPEQHVAEHILPNKTGGENNIPLQSKKQQAAPKLVIGKIIVEILPPATPVRPKIINRIVQPASIPGHAKTNKLSFGLGQS